MKGKTGLNIKLMAEKNTKNTLESKEIKWGSDKQIQSGKKERIKQKENIKQRKY